MTKIGNRISAPEIHGPSYDYKQAPTLTLSELIPSQFQDAGAGVPSTSNMMSSSRAERIEFVLMCRKLVAVMQEDLEWNLPENDTYDEIITTAGATFVEANMDHAELLQWCSIGQLTGVGMFSMSTERMDLVEQFQLLIRNAKHSDFEFETFPKVSLLDTYGLTLHAHKGTKPFRPATIIGLLRQRNPQLRGELEVIELSLIHI